MVQPRYLVMRFTLIHARMTNVYFINDKKIGYTRWNKK